MSDPQYILYETDGAVATITLNRPDARNAQNLPLLAELDDAFRARLSEHTRELFLHGARPATTGERATRGEEA